MEVVHRMLGVQHHGDHFVPAKPQENLEMIATPCLDLGTFHIWSKIHRVLVIVLKYAEHFVQLRPWNENQTGPVVNHPSRTRDTFSIVESLQLLHLHFAALQSSVSLRARAFG